MRTHTATWTTAIAILLAACSAHETGPNRTPPPPATPAPTGEPAASSTVLRFEGTVDRATGTLDVHYGAAPTRGITAQATLPYGHLCNQVYLHTVPGSVHWEGVCGALTLCGQVELVNSYAGPVSSATAIIDSVSASGVTATGSPYSYGTVAANSTSPPIVWSFSDTSSTDFTFVGHVDGVAPIVGLTASPPCFDYGDVLIYSGPLPTQSFTIINGTGAATGTLIGVLSGVGSSFTQMSNSCDGKTLGPGGSCNVNVIFNTSDPGFTTSPGIGQKITSLSVTDSAHPGVGVLVNIQGTLTCGAKGNQCFVDGDCCSGSCNVPTSPFCN